VRTTEASKPPVNRILPLMQGAKKKWAALNGWFPSSAHPGECAAARRASGPVRSEREISHVADPGFLSSLNHTGESAPNLRLVTRRDRGAACLRSRCSARF
jgi:hypothetical protein